MSELLEAARRALPGVTNWKALSNVRMDGISGRAGGADLEMSAFGEHTGVGGVYRKAAVYARIDGIGAEPKDTPDEAAQWLRAQVTARRDALNAALGEGWVPVGERLPDFGDDGGNTVDVWADGRRIPNCFRSGSDDGWGWYQRDDWCELDGMDVTHWMPLPAPPKTP